jgi:iron complex outermembrane receptor protein
VSAQQIRDLNITRLTGLQQLAPNLTVLANGPSSVAPLVYLRGIGSPSVALYSEPPVALYIDGVYTPRPTASAFDYPDLAGLEVLRGPQGTLFGRNTTGGAILVRTQEPRHEAGGTASAAYGTDNDLAGSVVLHTGDLTAVTKLRAKVVLQEHDRDGWVEFPGFDKGQWGGSLHTKAASLTVAADLTDRLTAEAAISGNRLRSTVGWQTVAANPNAVLYFSQSPSLGGPPFLMSQQPLDLAYRDPRLKNNEATIDTESQRLTLAFDGGKAFQLKSITAHSRIDENLTGQLGGSYVLGRVNVNGATTVAPIITHLTPAEPGKQRQFSEELNLIGTVGDFSYVGGLYYFTEKVNEIVETIQPNTPTGAAFVATLTDRSVAYSETTKSVAAYGQVSYRPHQFDDKLEITGGLRWTKDDKSVVSETFANSSATGLTTTTGTVIATGLPGSSTVPGAIRASTGSDSWKDTGWSGSISYQALPSVYAFFRASSAFRAGGFNAGSTNAPSYGPEKAVSYEGGVKSEWLDHRLRVNVVGFHTDYTGLQVNQFIGAPRNTNFIVNAGSAKYDGYEVEAQALLGHGFSADGNYGYVFPKYKTYEIGASPLPALCATRPNDPSCFQNVANVARFGLLSKTSFHVGLQYESPRTSVGTVTLRTDFSYKSSFLFGSLDLLSPNNTAVRSGIDRNLSARIILSDIPLGTDRVHLKLQAFGDNLTDNRFKVVAIDLGTTMNVVFNRPRNFGLILTADF